MKKIIFISAICLIFSSCSNWLDVKPKKLAEEEDLFSREVGFKEALTGLYIKMASSGLYAKRLTYDFMDILAQRYTYASIDAGFQDPSYYLFPSPKTEGVTNAVWKEMYNVIANNNNLLHHLDRTGDVITTPKYYEIIKGEAYGLRAFLHFDLLRMYGPIYKNDSKARSISYRTTFNAEASEILPADKVVELILADLKKAEELLKTSDPLTFEFPTFNDLYGFLDYRHKRMNLYAIKALFARVYMYIGDKALAAKYAKEVIDSGVFNLVTDNSVDRIFSKEIIFSLYVYKFKDDIDASFASGRPYVINDYDFFTEQFNVDEDGLNDIRVREGTGFVTLNNSKITQKFNQNGMWVSTEGTMPVIRLPEMYYILSECSDDYVASANYLNTVRRARGIAPVQYNTADQKLKAIETEYRKEFYGEGQLWYFYKRHFYESFLHCPVSRLTEKNYIFPIPEDELTFGK